MSRFILLVSYNVLMTLPETNLEIYDRFQSSWLLWWQWYLPLRCPIMRNAL